MSGPDSPARRRFIGMGTAGALVAGAGYAGVPESLTERYPDPRSKSLDERFAGLAIGNTPLLRIASGNLWAEGPAWSAVGRYLVWSDIPADRQQRWLADDGHVSTLRAPAGKSNGNTFDYAGRQLSCQHLHRRVVRYEHDGTRLNGPNDIVVHPHDGSIWFTDPGYGLSAYEGQPGELQLKEAVYRVDGASGRIDRVTDEVFKPNGLCFSPDYTTLYVADTGRSHYPEAPLAIHAFDVVDGSRLRNGREFASTQMDGFSGGAADGIRCDRQGNVWAACGWVGAGFDGVHVFAPDGGRIGLIEMPETCSNLCFGGRDRNRLFITASQSVYALYVGARGAHIS
ncbi:MAG: SMP-30/gluconolactonase/LRE family protein [Woeseiaceae bacterium]